MAKDGKTTLSADKINRGQVKKEKQNLILFFSHVFLLLTEEALCLFVRKRRLLGE